MRNMVLKPRQNVWDEVAHSSSTRTLFNHLKVGWCPESCNEPENDKRKQRKEESTAAVMLHESFHKRRVYPGTKGTFCPVAVPEFLNTVTVANTVMSANNFNLEKSHATLYHIEGLCLFICLQMCFKNLF